MILLVYLYFCRKEQNLIDKESYDAWVKKQQEQKDRQAELRRQQNEAKIKQAATAKELGLKGKVIIMQQIDVLIFGYRTLVHVIQ